MQLLAQLVAALVRLNRQYESEGAELADEARAAAEAPVLRRHVVLVLVDSLDRAAARAMQYARALNPDELRAVHIAVDLTRAEALAVEWRRLGLSHLPLERRRRLTQLAHANVTFIPYHLGASPAKEAFHVSAHASSAPEPDESSSDRPANG